jgi:hypothetical protein|uniref:Uncharacterized protein n=1 Tax=uncultured marine virus TaxID=186617 RepID=A0A0F7L6X6_9VIRU|nr:hypothetical protein [uncultured marine virus]
MSDRTDRHGIPLSLKSDKAFRQLARQVSREHRPSIVPADELWPETFQRWNAGERAVESFEQSQARALAALLASRAA